MFPVTPTSRTRISSPRIRPPTCIPPFAISSFSTIILFAFISCADNNCDDILHVDTIDSECIFDANISPLTTKLLSISTVSKRPICDVKSCPILIFSVVKLLVVKSPIMVTLLLKVASDTIFIGPRTTILSRTTHCDVSIKDTCNDSPVICVDSMPQAFTEDATSAPPILADAPLIGPDTPIEAPDIAPVEIIDPPVNVPLIRAT